MYNRPLPTWSWLAIVLLGIAAVGAIDFYTGVELRVLALYFLPLLLAGWTLGRRVAAAAAVVAALVWLGILYLSGTRFTSPWIWAANLVTEGAGFVIVAVLVAALRETVGRERSLARRDTLTGLANRNAFTELAAMTLALCARREAPVAMAFIDLDNFKRVNDMHGHARGDEVLKSAALLLLAQARSSDVVCRLGGDEFAVFLPDTDAAMATALMDRVRVAMIAAEELQHLGVTASIGIVSAPASGVTVNGLLGRADAVMYDVKRNGKNRVAIAPATSAA